MTFDGVELYPGYALDPDREQRPYTAWKPIIDSLGVQKRNWGIAFWFHSVNSFFGGKRPMDLLYTDPDQLIAAAEDDPKGIAHA